MIWSGRTGRAISRRAGRVLDRMGVLDMSGSAEFFDVFVVGGGVNGCGIARDAAGRGLTVALAEMGDLGSATSSASTKLFHGGLRYLEYFDIGLVREALIEREVLLGAMPHISWPMRFVLPYHKDMRYEGGTPASRLLGLAMPWTKGQRPAWVIRIGLFLYDHLGGRKILPGTSTVDLRNDPAGAPLKAHFHKAYEYSDCWVEDARLVVLNARDAEARGARIMPRTKVVSASRDQGGWLISTQDTVSGEQKQMRAQALVNAAGPWVDDVIVRTGRSNRADNVRLVRGSHIVTRKLFDHEKCYLFQGRDGRIIFAIPYETDFTLIGTTDADHSDPSIKPECTPEEADYLCKFASEYFQNSITTEDIVWRYSGVRPLFDDGKKTTNAITREYVIRVEAEAGAPLLNVFGGKITSYRQLSEKVVAKLAPYFAKLPGKWTAGVPLPGGDFKVGAVADMVARLRADYGFLDDRWARRLIKAYGTEAWEVLGAAASAADLGPDFGATLHEAEVRWLMTREYARTAEDVVWRRSKLGLRLAAEEIAKLDSWMASQQG